MGDAPLPQTMPKPPSAPPAQPAGPIRMAEVLAALSLATDLGAGKSMGHALRACYLGMHLARELGLPAEQQAELFYSFLLMHSGCTAFSLELAPLIKGDELAAVADITLRDDANLLDVLDWIRQSVSPGAPLPARVRNILEMLLQGREAGDPARGACEVAMRTAQRLGMPPGVQEAVRNYIERWDGKGPYGARAEAIPLNARLLHLALKLEAAHTARGRADLERWARAQKGRQFDPRLIDAFLAIAQDTALWDALARSDLWAEVLDMEPPTAYRHLDEARLDDVALAVADFVDLKSPATFGHSRETARLAEAIARQMGLPERDTVEIRRAALVHDLGHVALPGSLLGPGLLSEADREKHRLHPYFTERVLARVPALAGVAAIAGKHHERLDGSGYYQGLAGSAIPPGARILAVADEFQERLHAGRAQDESDPAGVLRAMEPDSGIKFARDCFEALAQSLGVALSQPARRRDLPQGLTEREVEVLRLVAKGLRNRDIAKALVITEKTVGHHLEHIYNKIGVSSRAAAVFFAVENELFG